MAKAIEIPMISVDRFYSTVFEDDAGNQLTLEERPPQRKPGGGPTIRLSGDMQVWKRTDVKELARALTIYADTGALPREAVGF